MTGHTPGPWSYRQCRCGDAICDQQIMSNQQSSGFSPADARLIAAAPDLVEALEGVLGGKCPKCKGWGEVAYFGEMVSCECNGKYRHTPTEDQIAIARAALARAKGPSHA